MAGSFLFPVMPRLLVSIQLPIQRVLKILLQLWVKQPEHEADYSTPSSARLRMHEALSPLL
jgi:hypothetical protein